MLDFSRPRKPTDNSFIESFNGKFGVERLNSSDPHHSRPFTALA